MIVAIIFVAIMVLIKMMMWCMMEVKIVMMTTAMVAHLSLVLPTFFVTKIA
jgi:hypothetical protein